VAYRYVVKFNHPGLDGLIGPEGLEKGSITLIVGAAGTGKTSLVLQLARGAKAPCIVDTEGISLKRVEQVGSLHAKIRRVVRFEEQAEVLEKLWPGECDFLAVDSLVMLYRLNLAQDPDQANWMLARQMAGLAKFAETQGVPVVVTGHIYEWEGKKKIVSGDVVKYWAKTILLLEKRGRTGERRAVLLKHPWKPEGRSARFKMCESGVC